MVSVPQDITCWWYMYLIVKFAARERILCTKTPVTMMTKFKPRTCTGHTKRVWHGDVIKWKHFPRYWPFMRGIHRSPVNSLPKGQWRGVLMFSLVCAWINGWVNNRQSGDLRRHRDHYDVIVMDYRYFTRWICMSNMQIFSSNVPQGPVNPNCSPNSCVAYALPPLNIWFSLEVMTSQYKIEWYIFTGLEYYCEMWRLLFTAFRMTSIEFRV